MKYQGVNPLEKLAPGEPYFFVRAQDKNAPRHTRQYADLLAAEGLHEQAAEVRALARAMAAWQHANPGKVKLPD